MSTTPEEWHELARLLLQRTEDDSLTWTDSGGVSRVFTTSFPGFLITAAPTPAGDLRLRLVSDPGIERASGTTRDPGLLTAIVPAMESRRERLAKEAMAQALTQLRSGVLGTQ